MNASTVLLLGDITGKGCVGLRMLTAELERMGHEVLALPTALISNIFRLGRHEALETTDYLLRTLDTWAQLGIGYSAMYVGYVTGCAQARALCGAMDEARSRGVQVIVDPILGDGGTLYRSVTPDQAEAMRLLCGHADLLPIRTGVVLLLKSGNRRSVILCVMELPHPVQTLSILVRAFQHIRLRRIICMV